MRTAVHVLAYHAVAELPAGHPNHRYGVSPSAFRAHLDLISRDGYTFIGADQLLAFLDRRTTLPPKCVLLTFDDCHESLGHAADIMARRGIPGLAFAVAAALDDDRRDLSGIGALLDAPGLRRLQQCGVEIGAHSDTHADLTHCSPVQLWAETGGSMRRFETAGVGRPRMFAYPFGAHDARVRDAVRGTGAAAAFTVDPGVVRVGDDRFALRRIEIYNGDTGRAFRAKVRTGGGLLRIRAAIRLRSRLRGLRPSAPPIT